MMTALRGIVLSSVAASDLEVEGDGGGGRFVTRAKNRRSALRGGHGREPLRPIPREGVVATMRVSGGRGRSEEGVGEVDMLCH